jgi:hypothetical protein
MGHFCHICGRSRPNEKFSGRVHRTHVCKDCQRMPREKREWIERLAELYGFLHQSNISPKNLKRLQELRRHSDPEVATLAALILNVASVLPGKRSRWLKLAQRHRQLFYRAVGLLGVEYFQEMMAGHGDFESPLWKILNDYPDPCAKPSLPLVRLAPSRASR